MGGVAGRARLRDVFDEHRLLLVILRFFGIAPFAVRRGKPVSTPLGIVVFAVHASCLLYCLCDAWAEQHFRRLSKYALTVLVYDAFGIARSAYAVFALAKFLVRRKVSARVWTGLDDVDEGLATAGAEAPPRTRKRSVAATVAFLVAYAAFIYLTYGLQTKKSKLTTTFWAVWYVPLFQSCLVEVSFAVVCFELKRKLAAANAFLAGRASSARRRGDGAWRSIRALRDCHFRGYEIVKDLDSLYGTHFFYIFASYFLAGTVNFCNIIRLHESTSPTSVVRYKSAVYWTAVQVAEILLIVFSAVLLNREVQRMMLNVHKYLALAGDNESRSKLELQSFSLQLHHCPYAFTASGFFKINCKLLVQLGVAVMSNTLFFVQIDKLKRERSARVG